LKERADALEARIRDKNEALEARVKRLEENLQWIVRIVITFVVLGVLGAVFVTQGKI
jgi:Na+/serine symporter